MFAATKYRLYPTALQTVLLEKHFGCTRWFWNRSLAAKTEAWTERKENLSRGDLSAPLPMLKKDEATAWLAEVNSQSLQSVLIDLDSAFSHFFRRVKTGSGVPGFPRFKSKHARQSFQVPQSGAVGENFVKLPKLGKIKASISRVIEGRVKTITVSRTTTGKYFASVLVDTGVKVPVKMPVTEVGTVGIDLGLTHFAVLSTGERIENPRLHKLRLKQIARASRIMARRTKGGTNRNKARCKLARVHEQTANARKDFLHKLTTRLVRENQTDTFAIEDLAVSNMVKNRPLSRSIADAGWKTFRTFLQYKAERAGKNVLVIGRFVPSSKTCPCGLVNHALKLSDRVWTCLCGKTHDRDLLAARNIKSFALHPQNKIPQGLREYTPEENVA